MKKPTPTVARNAALEVLKNLRNAGHDAYFAGGSVRDDVMGVTPKDFDITTSATPEEVTALFPRCVEVGAQFGVIVVLHGGDEIEVATFRTEGGYADGRRPDQVAWATAKEDVLRRDFTVNGLLGDPLAEPPEARVIDHVGGLQDIDAKLIRAIGEPTERFAEDQLRLLRALRFAARLNFTIEEDTWFALRALADTIHSVSAERTRDELQRILTEGGAKRGWALLRASDLMERVLPEPRSAAAVEARLCDAPLSPERGWTAVLMDVAPAQSVVFEWGKRLRTSKALTRHVATAVQLTHTLLRYEQLSIAQRKRLVRMAEFPTALWAASRAARAGQRPAALVNAIEAEAASWDEATLNPTPLIDGGTLRELGFTPGPRFKEALDAVEDGQLEGQITLKAEAIAVATTILEVTP
ncbi:MAG: CCA tRNA nucleotidyltransferase [Myxococcota bacterium]